jgi:pimeloyl-ACP methyl ester carboxylesterase
MCSLLLLPCLNATPILAQSPKLPLLYLLSHGQYDGAQIAAAPDAGNRENVPDSTTADDSVSCSEIAPISIALDSSTPATSKVSGELCATPEELRDGATVQLLIHGATYNRDYWNFASVGGIRYSYARDVASHGFPALAIDLPGTGASSHPSSELLTVQAEAFVTHQIVQALRNSAVSDVRFGKVITVGHSLGSVVVWEEAIAYGDTDGVIVTGAAHSITTKFLTSNAFYPAIKDPKFARSRLDSGYLSTVPGTRAELFYSAPDFDPALLPNDEAGKDVVPAAELTSGLPIVTSSDTLAIRVPVLTILGGDDLPTCGVNPRGVGFDCSSGSAIATQEAAFYAPEARIHACMISNSGHDVSLAVNHELQAADMVAWSSIFVGQTAIEKDQAFRGSLRGLPWNDGLPWNCGGVSAGSAPAFPPDLLRRTRREGNRNERNSRQGDAPSTTQQCFSMEV